MVNDIYWRLMMFTDGEQCLLIVDVYIDVNWLGMMSNDGEGHPAMVNDVYW